MLSMNEFNLTHFERIIQNLKWINLTCSWIRKTSICFSCYYHSKYQTCHYTKLRKIFPSMVTLLWFFDDVHSLFWPSIFIIYLLPASSEKNEVHTGNLTHFKQILQLINFCWIKNIKGIKINIKGCSFPF